MRADAPAANVGVSILRDFVMTIDFGQDALWLERRSAVDDSD